MGVELAAVSVGQVAEEELKKLGNYGVSKVYSVSDEKMSAFANTAYAAAVTAVAEAAGANAVVLAQTYNGRAIAPRIAAKLEAAPVSGAISLTDPNNGFAAKRMAYSGKGVQDFRTDNSKVVITVKTNSYKIQENNKDAQIEAFDFEAGDPSFMAVAKEIVKAADGVSLTEAAVVVSAGRGMKGPENWGILEELAGILGGELACSRPVSDVDWRPHSEHVGQTGIVIRPTLYIACGISGAIQHLAGVNNSKVIVVINKDPEAPFFGAADYGIVGDLFEVVPKLNEALKKYKG